MNWNLQTNKTKIIKECSSTSVRQDPHNHNQIAYTNDDKICFFD